MIMQFLLGVAGGVLAAKMMSRRRCAGGHGHDRGWHHGHRFHPGALLHLAHGLHLDGLQREQVKDIFRAMQRFGMEARFDRAERLDALTEAIRADKFDRAHVEQVVAAQHAKEEAARRDILDRIQLFHAGLTTEQREKLKQFFGEAGEKQEQQQSPPPPPPPVA